MIGPDMPVQRQTEGPNDSGVYFMFAPDDELIYIGLSLGIQYRMVQHFWAGRKCACYGAVYMPPGPLLLAVETAYIHALKPPLNLKYDMPRLEIHDQMVARILELWG